MRWLSATGGAIVAAIGALTLAAAVSGSATAEPPSAAAPVPPSWWIAGTTTTLESTGATVTDEIMSDELHTPISDLLIDRGYAELVPTALLATELPDNVVATLEQSGAVLVVENPLAVEGSE